MEYLQKCFYKSTDWNEDNIYSNITATSHALLEFSVPNGCKLDISSKSTECLASSFTLSNYHSINGSLAYLYSSIPLRNTMGTREVSLQDAIAGFKIIEPHFTSVKNTIARNSQRKDSLLYGRMYFPGSALEAMIIKRFSSQTQLLVKCINNPHLDKNGTMIIYLQKNAPQFLRELIYSTNDALIGFRCLYNFGNLTGNQRYQNNLKIPNFDNSAVSVGAEIWYAAMTMSPGLSTAFRYSTRSTTTGKPLTMTLACNPVLGHISSTYTVKTSVSSSFCSKYDFNFFSYASNLSLGFELYNFSKNSSVFSNWPASSTIEKPGTIAHPPLTLHHQNQIVDPIQNFDNYYHINPTLLSKQSRKSTDEELTNETVMTAFQNLVKESDFSSVIKLSTSLNDKMLKVLWEGKCKDFLISTGFKMNVNPVTNSPEFNRFGITLSYAS